MRKIVSAALLVSGCSGAASIAAGPNNDAGALDDAGGSLGSDASAVIIVDAMTSDVDAAIADAMMVDAEAGIGDGGCSLIQRATPAELAKSPRTSFDAEWLALELSGALVASDDVYAQVAADLNAIVNAYPDVSGIHMRPSASSGVVLSFDPALKPSFGDAGPYPWDCLDEYYAGKTTVYSSLNFAVVTFTPRLNTQLLVPDYKAIPGVKSSDPDYQGGDGDDICVVEESGGRVYIFDHATGDCPSGCISHAYYGFRVDSSGVTVLGAWDSKDAGSPTLPAWLTSRPACKKNL